MGRPDNSVPARPPGVPDRARWDPKEPGFEWIDGALDAEGRRHGRFKSWTREGVLHGESHYVAGRVHGKNLAFHPDGTIASEADWVDGVIMDSAFHRSAAPTTEPFAHAAPGIWSVRYSTRDGKTNYTIRYFARDGSEVGPDGQPLPVRPSTVSADARWFPEIERWVDGEIERGTNAQVGRWRWWATEGVLRHEEHRDAQGAATYIAKYRVDGTIEKKVQRDARGEQRELYNDVGKLVLRTRVDDRGRQTYAAVWTNEGELVDEVTRTYEGDALAAVVETAGRVKRFEAKRTAGVLACRLYRDDGSLAATGSIAVEELAGEAQPPPPQPLPRRAKRADTEDPATQIAAPHAGSALPSIGLLVGTWQILDERNTLRREIDTTPFHIAHEVTGKHLGAQLGEAVFRADEATFATPSQLRGIDDEPWHALRGARDRDVVRFPRIARGLVAADPLVRDYSLRAIRSEVLTGERDAVTPVAATIVPYLAAVLSHPQLDRSPVLALLQDIAQVSLAGDDDAARAAAHALDASWPAIFAQFAAAPLEDRRRIFELAKLAPAAKPAILEIARKDSDATLRSLAARTVVELPTFTLADAAALLADKDALVRATTAIALGLHRGPEAPREAAHGLDDALRNWRDYAKRYAELPFAEGHVLAQIALAAGAIRTPDARSLTHQLCAVFEEVDGRSAIVFARGLLALGFGPDTGDLARPYAKRFVEILETLGRSKQFWMFEAAACDVLERWRIPRTRLAIIALVAELRGLPNADAAEAAMAAKLER